MRNKSLLPGFTAGLAMNPAKKILSRTTHSINKRITKRVIPQFYIGNDIGSGANEHANCVSSCLSSEGEDLSTCSWSCLGVGWDPPIVTNPNPHCTPGCSPCVTDQRTGLRHQRCWGSDCSSHILDCPSPGVIVRPVPPPLYSGYRAR